MRPVAALQAQLQQVLLGGRPILQDLRLSLAAGRWTAIVGPNGAGKSTLLRVLAGLQPCTGQVQLLGRPLADWPARERARRLAWLGQQEGGGEDLLAWDVAMLGRLPHRAWLAAPTAQDCAAVQAALRASQAWALRGRRLGELSGGERQRVLLARLLAVQAQVALMDEPLAHLDPPHQADWLASVRALVAGGATVVSVLHELNMALQADDIAIIHAGRLAHFGAAASSATHRALQAAFAHRIAIHPVQGQWIALPQEAAHAD
ncbi:ABC transporter ATP-binding protein [Comamonas sp. NLF-1-9]|uniref:ABC transporter ATP-binding protein n=1 Tax=Comamonas sp. NLF-1-9 TaxID=2853163 RepID=UPI001C4686B1|nr:ABC transporter ATP-binding protein [Comamonas sp. NLF-1-9]QXL83182.1 ABC transporter ATP-binding protein [Comamonas sp. NLF-1-9]